jgi:hypothetical protein
MGTLEKRRMRDDFGVEVITFKPTPGHPEVLKFINFLAKQVDLKGP